MTDYTKFIGNIKQETGIDLSLYKTSQMKRRLTGHYEKKGFQSFTEYYDQLRTDKEMVNDFLDKMTINISEFYRNARYWEVLEKTILPQLISKEKKLKIWSAACATGEEPYSLAIMLSTYLPLAELSIVATDLDNKALESAKIGRYSLSALKDVPHQAIDDYFVREGSSFQLKDEVKQAVTFQQHNLLSDPFDSNYDLIVCRNVLIYFTEEAKEMVYVKLAQALKPGGILFVGSTEQILDPSKYGLKPIEMLFYQKI